jgi:tRNA (mo5U34)-methyltransferase
VGDRAELRAQVSSRQWYHTLELAPGVVTPGWFDTRPFAAALPWPDLHGARCLDIGTFDGFFAFEMERRGAAEVLAVDVMDPAHWDWPVDSDDSVRAAVGERKGAGDGFEIARAALESSVVRREVNVYDLDPDEIGTFDVVYLGSILLHLRDPVRALERVRSVCRGTLLSVDAIDLELGLRTRRPAAILDGRGRPWWWKPNLAGLRRMIEAAGFEVTAGPARFFMKPGAGQPLPPLRPRLLRTAAGREAAVTIRWGDPHAYVVARPRGSASARG